ncbi:YlzJ-like protein [Cytobacillus horneckiae]|uniref:Ribonuclease n=1 Tax=Cytobacillus horneckiae TaxID=549687 RepID=A0A2N0ZLW8_9BACI|nr:YlzJ-like family protein [Cytobacillus horneckiae]NRG43677.1 YlzJ-like family protein [Bacillus sp. CRN 9]MBN6887223.1 YlzJ-like family protein [Cytobacillus horneckiae]MCM3178186.1 YlzJ-like family protein [Cytobacillus horneckiae]MEC1157073.1 YlzJ-like family protein [Cytobacillus horneckiae]MED2939901.1 YlzJ-like family protein [Cytobacillus horneckiae]
MILYTTMPYDLVYQSESQEYEKQKIINHHGIPLLVEIVSGAECIILQVMSSNPNDFMNETYSPGTKITLS